jgi:hypothetical protein
LRLGTPEKIRELQGKLYQKASRSCENHWMKIIGKSRLSGRKPNIRFDEGELEIELSATTPALYSTELVDPPHRLILKNW